MRTFRSLVVAFLILGPAVSPAFAVSIRDLVALSHEGISDEVLVALMQSDGSKFSLNANDIRSLKADGLSDTVILAMLRTGKPVAPVEDELVQEPSPHETGTLAQPVPIVVEQTVTQRVNVQSPRHSSEPVYVPVPVYVAVPTARPAPVKQPEPVYWGYGGQRRPDAWKEPEPVKPAATAGPIKKDSVIK